MDWPQVIYFYGPDGKGPEAEEVAVVPADIAGHLYQELCRATEENDDFICDEALSRYEGMSE